MFQTKFFYLLLTIGQIKRNKTHFNFFKILLKQNNVLHIYSKMYTWKHSPTFSNYEIFLLWNTKRKFDAVIQSFPYIPTTVHLWLIFALYSRMCLTIYRRCREFLIINWGFICVIFRAWVESSCSMNWKKRNFMIIIVWS